MPTDKWYFDMSGHLVSPEGDKFPIAASVLECQDDPVCVLEDKSGSSKKRRKGSSKKKQGAQCKGQRLYKTELCRNWQELAYCRYGEKCQYAHGQDDLRGVERHPKYKTKACRTFNLTGACPYGSRCNFQHHDDILPSDPESLLPPSLLKDLE